MLKITDLRKTYASGVQALRDVSLEIPPACLDCSVLTGPVLLDANPLRDIRNTQKINAVMLNGEFFLRSDLNKLLDEAAVAAAKN